MNAQATIAPIAQEEAPKTGYAAEYPGRTVMRNVPRNVDPNARYKIGKPYSPRVPECAAANQAILEILQKSKDGTATGWELHKACQPFDPPFFGYSVNHGRFVKVGKEQPRGDLRVPPLLEIRQ